VILNCSSDNSAADAVPRLTSTTSGYSLPPLPRAATYRFSEMTGHVRDDQLALLEEFVGNAYAFTQQASRILPQIEDQTFQIAHLIERFSDFMLGRFWNPETCM